MMIIMMETMFEVIATVMGTAMINRNDDDDDDE